MINEKDLGIYIKSNKTFYILETGSIVISSHVTRIKKALIQKNLITMTDTSYTDSDQYEVLTYKEAKSKEYNVEKLYLNSHIRKHFENEKSEDTNW